MRLTGLGLDRMSQYKVRRTHPGWFRNESTEDDERSGALVEDLNRRLRAQLVATDVAFEASRPGYGVWLRIDADSSPLAALAGIGQAACRHPWRQTSADEADIQDTVLGKISKADLSGCQMDDQSLKAIFRDFFSQLRLLRPVAMLHLGGCGLTKTCAQLFSWCAANLELTRLDVSNNPDFSFQGEGPFAELDLQGFRSFVRRSAQLEALGIHHTGFSNPQLISMCNALGAMGKAKLKHVSIGPPRDLCVTAEGCQLQAVPFSDECLAAIASMVGSLTSMDLVVIHGLSPEQTEALCAAAPSRLHSNTSDDGCLRLSSASRERVEWAEFGPLELDERLLTRPEVLTIDADPEAGDEHMAQQHGEVSVSAAALATAPGKLHVNEHVQQAADPFARAHAVRHERPRRQHRRRPQSGGQRRIGPAAGQRRIGSAAKQQVRRCKKRRAAAEHFVDDAAGEAAAGSEVAELCAARAPGSQDRPDNRCSTSQGSMASSEGDLDSEDAYPAEDWAALEQAAAGAAYTDALSDDSLSEQESELCADRPQHDVDVSQQAVSPRRHDLAARPDEEHRAGGNAPPRPVPAAGSASLQTPRRRPRNKQKRSRITREVDDLKSWPTENPESAEKHPAKGIFARVEGPRRRTQDVISDQVRAWQARLHGHEPGSDSPDAQRKPVTPPQDPGMPDALEGRPSHIDESSQGEEASQASQSSGDNVASATARPSAATQQQFMLQDSEEQEDMQQTRPGSGVQRPIFLMDSEEQDELMQPNRSGSPGQHIIQILDSEDQNRLNQPGEVSLPGPSAAGEASDPAATRREEPASEAAASGAASHQQETAHMQATQMEGDLEAGIAHLPAKMQRELRGLQRPWHFDPRLAEHPVNMARFRPEHSKRQVRQPERFKFEGASMGSDDDGGAEHSPKGSTEAAATDTASDEDELPLLNLVKRSESPAAALAVPVAVRRDSPTDSRAHKEAVSQQLAQPVSIPEIVLMQPTPTEASVGHDQITGQHRAANEEHPGSPAVPNRVPAMTLKADTPALTGDQAHDAGSPCSSARPACSRDDRSAIAQGPVNADSYATGSSTPADIASEGVAAQQEAPIELENTAIAMLQAQPMEVQDNQQAALQAALQRAERAQLQSRKEREEKRLSLFPSDRRRDEYPPNENRFMPQGDKRPRQPPAWLELCGPLPSSKKSKSDEAGRSWKVCGKGATSAKVVQHTKEGPGPIASAAAAQKENAPPAARPMEANGSPADPDIGLEMLMDLIPDSEDEA